MKFSAIFRAACAAVLVAAAGEARAADPAQLTFNAGLFDLVGHHKQEFQGGVEYRFGHGLFDGDRGDVFRGLKPNVGFMANSASAYFLYAGFAAPLWFDGGRWELVPAAGMGAYHKGNGIDLGGTFEFNLSLGLSYAVTRNTRLGIALGHISNANTHRFNPGANSALVTFSWAFDGP